MIILPFGLKAYAMVFDSSTLPRQYVTDFLDTRSEVANWLGFFNDVIIIVSNNTAHQLAEIIRQGLPGTFFMLTYIPFRQYDGWLPKEWWDFINKPQPSGKQGG